MTTQTPTDALRLVPIDLLETVEGLLWLEGYEIEAQRLNDLAASPASPLPEGGGQCSGISGELDDPRLVEWGYTSLDEAITHLGKLLDNQAAFDGLAAPTGDAK